jgi:tetratricopeptide (TPR) repeat protein
VGELLLCKEPIAAMPYYIDGISINVYSLEELCYYFMNNVYLLERDFMNAELCTWVEQEIGRARLAERLREIMESDGKLSDFVREILVDTAYCTREETEGILAAISELEEKSDFECSKIRADRLMERQKYLSSIYEYRHLLDSEEAREENPVTIGNIWHNLGTAYAKLFLFDEAAHCYGEAYRRNRNEESLKGLLMCYRCRGDESGFIRVALENGLDDSAMQNIRDEAARAENGAEGAKLEEQLERIANYTGDMAHRKKQKELGDIILGWKDDYRRICRI